MCKTKRKIESSEIEDNSRPIPREKDLFSKYKHKIYDYVPEEDEEDDYEDDHQSS